MQNAARKAHEYGANTFQIFSSSPRMWRPSRPDPTDIRLFQEMRLAMDLAPLAIHDSYLINLGSANPAIRALSIGAFRGEIERAISIGAEYLVAHPGNYKGQSLEEGLMAVIEGIEEASRGIESENLTILLENTVGAGSQLGSRFEELAVIRQLCEPKIGLKIGYCLDTAHCFAFGHYNISIADGLRDTIIAAETLLGMQNVKVIHTNDSKSAAGSHVDRHEHIGQGYIGKDSFRRILNHPKLRSKAFILETPGDNPGDEQRNIETLKSLCRKSSITTKKSS